jgi:hypothetical protein
LVTPAMLKPWFKRVPLPRVTLGSPESSESS